MTDTTQQLTPDDAMTAITQAGDGVDIPATYDEWQGFRYMTGWGTQSQSANISVFYIAQMYITGGGNDLADAGAIPVVGTYCDPWPAQPIAWATGGGQ